MGEQRLIDANYIVEVAERAWDAWNLAMATQDTNRGVNKVIRRQELCKAVKAVADDAPAIDPETLPIVQQLRAELARVTEERDAAVADLKTICDCDYCENNCVNIEEDCCEFCGVEGCLCRGCISGANWTWRGLHKEASK